MTHEYLLSGPILFFRTPPNITIPSTPATTYSVNEGNARYWDAPTAEFVDRMKNQHQPKPYSLRYVGSMVSDVHRTLMYGGKNKYLIISSVIIFFSFFFFENIPFFDTIFFFFFFFFFFLVIYIIFNNIFLSFPNKRCLHVSR